MQLLNRLAGENKEPFYVVVPFIAEFWKTISNFMFLFLGIYHLSVDNLGHNLKIAYSLLILAGFCSGFHHATNYKCGCCSKEITWTLLIDWIPIVTSGIFMIVTNIIFSFSVFTFLIIGISICWLIIDNIFAPLNYWGHCIWHIMIALAITLGYVDYYRCCNL